MVVNLLHRDLCALRFICSDHAGDDGGTQPNTKHWFIVFAGNGGGVEEEEEEKGKFQEINKMSEMKVGGKNQLRR